MAHPAKLAYICHIFPHLTQTFVYREVEELQRAEILLTVFSMKPANPALMSAESEYLVADTVYLPPVTGAAVFRSQWFWLLRRPRRYLQALALVARGRYRVYNNARLWLHGLVDFARGAHLARQLVHAGGYGHLHAQFADDACTTTLVAALLTGIPFSFRSHTSPNSQLLAEKVRRAQFVVSASRYDRRVLVHWFGERVAAKIHVNHLGVPLDRYVPARPARNLSLTASAVGGENRGGEFFDPERAAERQTGRPLLLSVGTLTPKKGFEYLIRACRVLADRGVDYDCQIVGDGPDRPKLEDLVAFLGLGDRVTLAPYRPQEELRALFQQAAIFSLPCIILPDGNVDVIPLVLQEAMALARPVVSTPVSGIPELIRDGVNGLLVPERDHEALAEALIRLLNDPALAERLGAAARETVVQQFDVAVNAGELAQLFQREVPPLSGR